MATNFLNRWSQRKLDSDQEADLESEIVENYFDSNVDDAESLSEVIESSDSENQLEDLPREEEDNSIAALLLSEVDSSIKKAALRKLFLSGEFSEVDRLNDYDHDYTEVKSLSSEIVSKLREWMNTPSEEEAASELKNDSSETQQIENEHIIELDDEQLSDEASFSLDSDEQMGQNIPNKD